MLEAVSRGNTKFLWVYRLRANSKTTVILAAGGAVIP